MEIIPKKEMNVTAYFGSIVVTDSGEVKNSIFLGFLFKFDLLGSLEFLAFNVAFVHLRKITLLDCYDKYAGP